MQTLHGDTLDGRLLLDARAGQPRGPGVPREGERLRRSVHEADRGVPEDALRRDARRASRRRTSSVPYRDRGWFYYSRTEKGKQYPIYCRKKGSLEAPEEVFLDVNELAKGERFMSVGARDGHRRRQPARLHDRQHGLPRLHAARSRTWRPASCSPRRWSASRSVAWAPDNKTLFYATTDHAKRPYRLYRHTLGTDPSTDVLLYEEKDERFRVGAGPLAQRRVPLLRRRSATRRRSGATSRRRQPTAELTLIAPRETEHEYVVDHRGDLFYILTNDKGPQQPARHGAGRRPRRRRTGRRSCRTATT